MAVGYNPRVVTDGLVLALDAGNTKSYPGSGTSWSDLSGNSNTGTLTNGPTYSSDNGGSIVFDGTNDYVTTGDMFDPNSNFTFSSWVNLDAFGTPRTIISKQNQAGSIQIRINGTDNDVEIVDNNIVNVGTFSNFTLSLSTWYNIVVTRSSNTYSLYVDGVYKSDFTSTNVYDYAAQTIGKNFSIATEYWDGKISIIHCYDRALTASEIQQNYNALKGRYA
jgi:hypothetical protein